MKLTLSKIAEFISATGDFPREEVAQAYSIDSRTVAPGELFFAVKGERLDGHDYVAAALEKGAAAVVVDRTTGVAGELVVRDTLGALQRLAAWARGRWSGARSRLRRRHS